MMDTKSVVLGRKHTLLHYLVELLEARFLKIVDFPEEIKRVEDGSKVTLAQIRQNMIFIRDNLKLLDKLINDLKAPLSGKSSLAKTSTSSLSKFKDSMSDFYESATLSYEKLDYRFKKALELYESAVIHFGEEPKISPDEFFGIFAAFITCYATAKSENETARLKEEESKKREAERTVICMIFTKRNDKIKDSRNLH